MVSVLVIVYEHSTCSDGATAKLVRQVPHKRIDARHPDSDTSGALQIEAAGSCDCFRITSRPEVKFPNCRRLRISSNRRQMPRKYRIEANPMPSRIRGITFSLNLWSRRSDNPPRPASDRYGRGTGTDPGRGDPHWSGLIGLREENSAYSATLLLAWSQLLRTRHRCSRSTPLLRQLSPQLPDY
jgi:hypothetical protein